MKLETYVYECLMNRIMMMQRERFAKCRIPRDKQTSYDIWFEKTASTESELQDLDERDIFEEKTVNTCEPVHPFFMEDLDNRLDRDIQRKQLKQSIQKANLSEQQITVLKYSVAGYPQTQIGKRIGRSQAFVSKLYTDSIQQLRVTLMDMGVLEGKVG